MANPLNRNLKLGDKLMLRTGQRAVIAHELFGNYTYTLGTGLAVRLGFSSEPVRVNSGEIDVEATMQAFAKENGWEESK